MRRLLFCLMLLPAFCGCSPALRVLNPFDSVTAADAEWKGVKSGEVQSATLFLARLDPQVAKLLDTPGFGAILAPAIGQRDPIGNMMPVTLVGESIPRWVFCDAATLAKKCSAIPLNAAVSFAGQPVGAYWRPKRLTAAGVND